MVLISLLFFNSTIPALRVYFLFLHFVATCALFFVDINLIQIGMVNYKDDNEYATNLNTFHGYVVSSMLFLTFECLLLGLDHNAVSLGAIMHLFLDGCAIFSIGWICLDGLDWRNYIYIFYFCVLIPLFYDMLCLISYFNKRQLIASNKSQPIFTQIYYFFIRIYDYFFNSERRQL